MTEPVFRARQRLKEEKGFVLPAAIMGIALLTVLAVSALVSTGDDLNANHGMRESAKAEQAAQSGIEYVLANWATLKYDTLIPNPGDSLDLGWTPLAAGRTKFRAVIHRVDRGVDPVYAVRSSGSASFSSPLSRSVGLLLSGSTGGTRLFTQPYFGVDSVVMGGDGTVNTNASSNGVVAVRPGEEDKFKLKGDAIASGTVEGDTARISGAVTEGMPPVPYDTIPCPAGPYGPTIPGAAFNSTTGVLSLDTGVEKTISGDYYFSEFYKSGDGGLRVPEGEAAVFYVERMVKMSGGGFLNPAPNDATNLTIIGCGSFPDPAGEMWRVNGGIEASMGVYAPTHAIKVNGGASLYGAIMAKYIEQKGNFDFYYDGALDDFEIGGGGGGGGTVTAIEGSRFRWGY